MVVTLNLTCSFIIIIIIIIIMGTKLNYVESVSVIVEAHYNLRENPRSTPREDVN